MKILKLNLSDSNNGQWIEEYEHINLSKWQLETHFLESYVINNKIHIHFFDSKFEYFHHLIYDVTRQKLERLNKCKIDADYRVLGNVEYSHVLYHEKDSKLIFVYFNEEYQTQEESSEINKKRKKQKNRRITPDNLWYDLNGSIDADWQSYNKGILWGRYDFDAIIGIDDIVFSFYAKDGKMMIGCFDLLNTTIYESEKMCFKLPFA